MATSPQMSASQVNSIARQAIRARSVRMLQQIYTTAGTTQAATPVITVNPRNVGLINGFWVKVTGLVTNGSGVTIDSSDFGPSNLLSMIQFNDLSNNTRIQTPGWHVGLINSWKGKRPFGSAFLGVGGTNTGNLTSAGTALSAQQQAFDDPVNYGSNWTVNSGPSSLLTMDTGQVTYWYYVPLAYNPDAPNMPDLRGAVYANVLNATMQLLLTINPNVCVAAAHDSTSSMFVGASAGSVSAVTLTAVGITVYQDYFDQLPVSNQGVLLPILDLATIYELKQTINAPPTVGNDFPYQYANFRDFFSTVAVFVNNGSTGARGTGADVNYWALQSANFTNIWKVEPALAAIPVRQHLGADMPPGTYFFDSRNKPISTTQYGNMQLILNAATAASAPYVLVAVEDLALVQTLSMAGSLAAS